MKAPRLSRRRVLALSGPLLLSATAAWAEPGPPRKALVMFRRRGCSWCDAWDREVRPGYLASEAGRRLPLRELDLDRDRDHGITLLRPVRYTPTFALVETVSETAPDTAPETAPETASDGGLAGATERLRIEGYPGADLFWGYIDAFLAEEPQD